MTMILKTALGIAAGIFGTIFVGYCVYFDHQRRKDPNFKKKLRERRKANKNKCSSKDNIKLPDIRDHEAVQQFFLQEIQLGEELLSRGDFEEGVVHLGNAVAVCGQPNQLLQVLQQTLPPNAFQLLVKKLPALSQRIMEQPAGGDSGGSGNLVEDDVE